MTAEQTNVKKPVGDIAQCQVLPIDLDSMPSGQVLFTQCSPGCHDKLWKETLPDGEKQNCLINGYYTVGQLLGTWILY